MNNVAIVTGGAGGIGRATSLLLAREGAKVVIADILPAACKQVADEIKGRNGDALPLTVDVTQKASVQSLIKETLRYYQRIDILVNIVGGSSPKPVLEMSDDDWDKSINMNLRSVFLTCRAVLPAMIKQAYGKIVNLSSAQAFSGSATRASYTAAKLGVVGFSKSLALEVIRHGINVNIVAPGVVATERIRSMFSEKEWNEMVSARPMGRAVQPEEIARAILFLVQDEQASVTGQTIHVNGGAFMA